MKHAFAALVLLTALTSCGGDPDVVEQDTSAKGDSKKTPQNPKEQGALIASGFGQGDVDNEFVGLAAIVENKSDHAGQTVTVSFNLLDSDGEVIKTESQVDNFAWVGQQLAVVTETDLESSVVVASVEATLLIEDDGMFEETGTDLGTSEAKLVKGEYGGFAAKVKLVNPTSETIKDPGVKVICYDSSKKIAGGGYTYPELIAARGTFADEVSVTVSENAKTCTAFLEPSIF